MAVGYELCRESVCAQVCEPLLLCMRYMCSSDETLIGETCVESHFSDKMVASWVHVRDNMMFGSSRQHALKLWGEGTGAPPKKMRPDNKIIL